MDILKWKSDMIRQMIQRETSKKIQGKQTKRIYRKYIPLIFTETKINKLVSHVDTFKSDLEEHGLPTSIAQSIRDIIHMPSQINQFNLIIFSF